MATSWLSQLPIIGIAAITLTLGFTLTPASAVDRSHVGLNGVIVARRASSGPIRPAKVIPGATLPMIGGTHYVYADDGLFPNNSIDEFKATVSGLSYLGTMPTGSGQTYLEYGQNDIAIHGNCLVHSDSGGSIQSYAINPSTGLLTQISTLAVAGHGIPGDTIISADGQDAYVAAYTTNFGPSSLIAIPLGTGCVFGMAVFNNSDGYEYSIALPDATHLMSLDYYGGYYGIYTITGGTILALKHANRSTLIAPTGAATAIIAGQTYTFNGQYTGGVPQAEADVYTAANGALTPAPGSPQTDGNSNAQNGANVYFAPAYTLVTQTNAFSNTVTAYSMAGGTFTYTNSAALDPTSTGPVSQTSISHYLSVLSWQSGTIDACQLATSGIGSCLLEATVTGAGTGSMPGGLGVR